LSRFPAAPGIRRQDERAQIGAVASTHIGIERSLVLDGGLVCGLRWSRFAANRGPRLLELDRFQSLRLRGDHVVEPFDLFLKQNVDRPLFGKPLVVRFLEFVERTHQFGMRYGSIGGNAGFRFERSVSFNFHLVFLLEDGEILGLFRRDDSSPRPRLRRTTGHKMNLWRMHQSYRGSVTLSRIIILACPLHRTGVELDRRLTQRDRVSDLKIRTASARCEATL
jgi:hypothetical protein